MTRPGAGRLKGQGNLGIRRRTFCTGVATASVAVAQRATAQALPVVAIVAESSDNSLANPSDLLRFTGLVRGALSGSKHFSVVAAKDGESAVRASGESIADLSEATKAAAFGKRLNADLVLWLDVSLKRIVRNIERSLIRQVEIHATYRLVAVTDGSLSRSGTAEGRAVTESAPRDTDVPAGPYELELDAIDSCTSDLVTRLTARA